MLSLLRFAFYMAVLVFGAYFVFYKDVGGKSLAGHVAEVFDSDMVQRKIAGIKDDMREDLEVRLAKAKADRAEKSGKVDNKKHDGYDIINEADRESLSQLIEKKTQPKK
ncbi:MAG: hypothetical protein ACAI38_21795 [Myxococcota bacterium]|nr:hypothetical protein [Myxococcota bacterium]